MYARGENGGDVLDLEELARAIAMENELDVSNMDDYRILQLALVQFGVYS